MSELLATPSGMSASEIAVLKSPGASQHLAGSTRVGSKQQTRIGCGGGLWYSGTQGFGDFSGTQQVIDAWRGGSTPGSGGPASLPWGPTGTDTVIGGGPLQVDGTTTQITALQFLGAAVPTWNYKVAIRSMCATACTPAAVATWDPVLFKFTGANQFVGFNGYTAFTGDDWAHVIDAGAGGTPGWYRILSATASTIELDHTRHDAIPPQLTGFGTPVLNASVYTAANAVAVYMSTQAIYVPAATWVDTATFTLSGQPADTNTITVGGVPYEWRTVPAAGKITIGVDVATSIINLVAVLATDARITIVSSTTTSVTLRSSTTTSYVLSEATVNGTLDVTLLGNKLLVANSGTPFSAYTAGTDDTVEPISGDGTVGGPAAIGVGAVGTYVKVLAKVSSTTLQVEFAGIATPGATDINFILWKSGKGSGASNGWEKIPVTFNTLVPGAAWDNGAKTVTYAKAFLNYAFTALDKFVVVAPSAGGWVLKSYTIASRTDDDTIVLSNATGQPATGNNVYGYIVTKDGYSLIQALVLGTPFSFTPRALDHYYLYVDSDAGGGVVWPGGAGVENNPEECPTQSALTSLYSPWPAVAWGASVKTSNKSENGTGMVPAAIKGSLINHAWQGSFMTTPRGFLNTDRLMIELGPIDTTYNGTPFVLEVGLIPNFDPEAARQWSKASDVLNDARVAAKGIYFESAPYTLTGFRPVKIRITGTSGAIQTIDTTGAGDNCSQIWECEFLVGPQSSGTPNKGGVMGDPRFPCKRLINRTILLNSTTTEGHYTTDGGVEQTRSFGAYEGFLAGDVYIVLSGTGFRAGAYAIDGVRTAAQSANARKNKIFLVPGQPGMGASECFDLVGYIPNYEDFGRLPVRWQLLVQAKHPSMLGRVGYHGYYSGEPFSTTNGNGGVLFRYFGSLYSGATPTNVKLPMGPRLRMSSILFDQDPGGGT